MTNHGNLQSWKDLCNDLYLILKFVLLFSQFHQQLRVKGFRNLSAKSHSHAIPSY